MLQRRSLRCITGSTPMLLVWRGCVARRYFSTRQADRLRQSSKRRSAEGGTTTSHTPSRGACGGSRATCGPAQRVAKPAPPSVSASATSTTAHSALSSGRAKPLPGRFNRLVAQNGFLVTFYHYVLGESINLVLTYLLHVQRLGIGDTGSWLGTLGVPVDRFLNVGPTVYGLQLSPRLVLNYLVVNACTYPSIPLQLRFCIATAPIVRAPLHLMGRLLRASRKATVPKAPSATSS
ncbi:hypothetical protein JKF63_02791 [Porcisia hertigi]|uniref:Uncharacterized protein n=1 Tax=Porcisia hertigi TaxID=2761500 RepID=A0A836IM93_9TRYP|nr:hypothetical protein JKF63_02791 [Porcisia hertigi]